MTSDDILERIASAIHEEFWRDDKHGRWRAWADAHPDDRRLAFVYARAALAVMRVSVRP